MQWSLPRLPFDIFLLSFLPARMSMTWYLLISSPFLHCTYKKTLSILIPFHLIDGWFIVHSHVFLSFLDCSHTNNGVHRPSLTGSCILYNIGVFLSSFTPFISGHRHLHKAWALCSILWFRISWHWHHNLSKHILIVDQRLPYMLLICIYLVEPTTFQ